MLIELVPWSEGDPPLLLPAYQGQGIGTAAAVRAATRARDVRSRRYVHAFPSVDNPA